MSSTSLHPASAETTAPSRAFYPALDGLRAIAFVMVFLQHYISLPWGWTGVNAFFVLSGFLITGILFDTRDQPHRARNFYIRRTLRIFPLYYGIFLVALLLEPVLHWVWFGAWAAWPLYLGNFLRFLPRQIYPIAWMRSLAVDAHLTTPVFPYNAFNFGHFWSLCVEEQFYLVWPWVVFQVRSRRSLIWICAGTVLVVPLLRVIAQANAPTWMLQQELLYRVTPFQLDSLLLGGLIALLWRGSSAHTQQAHRIRLLRVARWTAGIAAVLVVVYLSLTLHLSDPNWCAHYIYPSWRLTWGLSFVNIFTAALILCCLESSAILSRVFAIRPLRWVGRISYGAYIFHDVFRQTFSLFVGHVGRHSAFVADNVKEITVVVGLAGTLGIAWLSFRFFETPFLNLKERWTTPAKKPVSGPAAQTRR